MGIFSRFEGKVDDVFDGIAGSMFKSPIEPSQIAKKCEKRMHRSKLVGKGVQYAPTLYTVMVNVDDDRRLFGFYPTLAGEIETYLVGSAEDAALVLECRPLVRFIADDSLKSGKFDVIAEVVTANIISELREEEAEYYGLDTSPKSDSVRRTKNRAERNTGGTSARGAVSAYGTKSGNSRQSQRKSLNRFERSGFNNDLNVDLVDVGGAAGVAAGAAGMAAGAAGGSPDLTEVAGARAEHHKDAHSSGMLVEPRTGRSYPIRLDSVTIGRESDCDIVIGDASISRTHARITRNALGSWYIADLNSTNGTKLNNRRISESPLNYGDEITIGTTILLFERG